MKLKNGQLVIYEIDSEYLNYLSKFDNNVRLKSERRYTGILVNDNNIDYCIPLTCKVKKRNSKLTINIKNKGDIIAQLTINNMIPVTSNVVNKVDVSLDRDKDYLNSEIDFLRNSNVINTLISKAENVIKSIHNPKSKDYDFFKKLCTNLELLEKKCIEYSYKNKN